MSETIHVVCPHCGGVHEPRHKRQLQLGGPNNRPGIWLPDLCRLDADGRLRFGQETAPSSRSQS